MFFDGASFGTLAPTQQPLDFEANQSASEKALEIGLTQ